MKKKNNSEIIPYIAAGVAALVLVFAAVITTVKNGKNDKTEETTAAKTEAETVAEIDATMPTYEKTDDTLPTDAEGGELSYEMKTVSDSYTDNDVLLISRDVSYPVFSGTDSCEKINASIYKLATRIATIQDTEKTEASDDYKYFNFTDYEFMPSVITSSCTAYVKGNGVSVLLTLTETGNGANGEQTLYALNYDSSTGNSLSLSDFLGSDSDYVKQYLYDVFLAEAAKNPENFYADVKSDIKSSVSLSNYYLTEDGITVFCRSGEIAPSAYGEIKVTLPYDTFRK